MLENLIATAKDAIISLDEAQNIVLFNPAAEAIFRCRAEDALGQPLDRFLPVPLRAAHRSHVEHYDAHGDSTHEMGGGARVLNALRADGEPFPIEASIAKAVTPLGKRFTVILRDVTERERMARELRESLRLQKHAEAELRESRDRLRELSAALQSIREEEKSRIARELHDELGQQLTALKMDIAAIAEELLPEQTAAAHRAEDMKRLIATTMRSVRQLATDLRPVMLDNLGLAPTLEWLTQDFARRSGIAVELVMPDEELGASGDAATAVFRIVQEALTNVARHAKAQQVTVEVLRQSGHVRVRVRDDGAGYTAGHRAERSFGVLGMRERAEVLGGSFRIVGTPAAGTTVEATIPAFGNITGGAT